MIGGEFEIGPALLTPTRRLFDPRTAFASGRAALHAIVADAVRRHDVGLVLLPDYLCRSMVVAVEDAGCAYDYYPVSDDLRPDVDVLSARLSAEGRRTAVVLVDYFGLVDPLEDASVLGRLSPRPVIVLDQSQSALAFSLPDGADYSFTTYRKSLPTPDGAPVLTRRGGLTPPTDLEAPFVEGKLAGNEIKARAEAEGLPDEAYLVPEHEAECLLDDGRFYERRMSDTSATILGNLDLEAVAARRRENFATLAASIGDLGVMPIRELRDRTVPLFLPVLLPERDRVRAVLASKRIFCPVHWPWPRGLTIEPRNRDSRLWREELSLVIDQRYGSTEMALIADALAQALERR